MSVNNSAPKSTNNSPLHRLFVRQQRKLRCSLRTTKLLKTFAQNDNQHIAQLIKQWLNDEPVDK